MDFGQRSYIRVNYFSWEFRDFRKKFRSKNFEISKYFLNFEI
jgi:hypothetical protein